MANSCEGGDSEGIDNQYHKKFSDEDWKSDRRIFGSLLLKWNSTIFLQWRCRFYSFDSAAKMILKSMTM